MKRRLTNEDKEAMFHLGCHTCNSWDTLAVAVLKGRALRVWCTDCGSEVALMDMDEDEFSQADELLKWSGCWMCYERLDFHKHEPTRK